MAFTTIATARKVVKESPPIDRIEITKSAGHQEFRITPSRPVVQDPITVCSGHKTMAR